MAVSPYCDDCMPRAAAAIADEDDDATLEYELFGTPDDASDRQGDDYDAADIPADTEDDFMEEPEAEMESAEEEDYMDEDEWEDTDSQAGEEEPEDEIEMETDSEAYKQYCMEEASAAGEPAPAWFAKWPEDAFE